MLNFSHHADKRSNRLLYILLAFITALLYDVFFWKQSVGLGFLLFLLCFHIGFFIVIYLTRQIRIKYSLLLLPPIFAMAAEIVIYNNDFTKLALPIISCFLTLIYVLIITLQNPNKHPFHLTSIPLIRSIDLAITKWKHIFNDLLYWGEGGGKKIALGLVISIPFLFIFTLLFMNADAIFAELVNEFNVAQNSWRLFRTLAVTLLISGIFYYVIHESHSLVEKKGVVSKIDHTIIGILLVLINLLFAFFVFIQIKYLFGNADYVLKNGITFADYARNGFFQLVWVIVLTTIILLVVYRSHICHGTKKMLSFLQILLIAQVGIIASSALKRMNLYQEAYGYTVLRLYVEWFVYFIIAILVLSGVCLLLSISFKKYLHATLISIIIALTFVGSINVDYMIGRENVNRYINKGKMLDLVYLNKLSVDVIPSLEPMWNEMIFRRLNIAQIYDLRKIIENKISQENTAKTGSEYNMGKKKALDSMLRIPDYVVIKMNESLRLDKHFNDVANSLAPSMADSDCYQYDKKLFPVFRDMDVTFRYCHVTQFKKTLLAIIAEENTHATNDEASDIDVALKTQYYYIYENQVPDLHSILPGKLLYARKLMLPASHKLSINKDGWLLETSQNDRMHAVYKIYWAGEALMVADKEVL